MVDFQKVIKRMTSIQAKQRIKDSKKPLVIQFFSHGCSACHEASPHIQAAVNHNDDVEVIMVDGDFALDFTDELGVDGFPTAVAFRNGQKVAALEGSGEANDYGKFFARCMRPKPVKKAKPAKANKPKPRPKPKPTKPSRKAPVKKKVVRRKKRVKNDE